MPKMTPNFLTIDKPELLLEHKAQIFSLFQKCFAREIDSKLWEWLYIQNPIDTSVVSLAFDNDHLIGHYGFIATKFNHYRAFVSITLMVDPSIQNPWIFLGMIKNALELLDKKADILIAFPNKNSYPLFTKMLKWNLIPTFVAQVDAYMFNQNISEIQIDTTPSDFLQWRLSRPNGNYYFKDGMILKPYKSKEIDVVYSPFQSLLTPFDGYYNILTQDPALISKKIFDYPFVYHAINQNLTSPLSIKPDLLMSDVF